MHINHAYVIIHCTVYMNQKPIINNNGSQQLHVLVSQHFHRLAVYFFNFATNLET